MGDEYRDNLSHGIAINNILNPNLVGEFNTMPYGLWVSLDKDTTPKREVEYGGVVSTRLYDILLSNVSVGYTPEKYKNNKTSKRNKTIKK